jgi:1,4-dihydroxy-2-naphthoate polyprenyltransferase
MIKSWISAFRLRTLPLAVSCIGMGGFLAQHYGVFSWSIFLLAVATTIFLQILSNLANDYGDAVSGIDSHERKGPSRAVQSGAITKKQMKNAIVAFAFASLISGVLLLFVSFGVDWQAWVAFFALGILCIAAAITYTVGRKPYGYVGLGDLSVLIFFGVVGVGGSYYLFAHQFSKDVLLPALSCGFFSIGVLNINNIRDIESDKKAGKFSLPVRMGKQGAAVYHTALLILGLLSAALFTIRNYTAPTQWAFVLVAPLLFSISKAVLQKPSAELDPYLKRMALTTLLFVLLFGIGLLLG